MRFDYTQIFLLAWIVVFWFYYFLTYGRAEGKHERSVQQEHDIKPKWRFFFGTAFFAWTAVIIIYFFNRDSINWIWKLSFLDHMPVKIAAMAAMCFSLLLFVLFTENAGRSIRSAVDAGEKPKLTTKGIYRYIRHPCYLAFLIEALGIFFIIPNVITLVLLAYTCVATCGHTIEEEQKLIRVYGEEYERYRREVGRFLPKLR